MEITEHALLMECEGDCLVGVLARPSLPSGTGVVIVVGGPQYRVGSHRQFVLLSRALAIAGHPVLRFDYRGMGDSTGDLRNFENVNADIACAITTLQAAVPGLRRIVLWGLCDGASAALLYCHATQDQRVGGLCLVNPWVRSTASLAKTHVKHYYRQRLREKEFWAKLLSGRVAWRALAGLAQNLRAAHQIHPQAISPAFQDQMAVAWMSFSGPILLLLSGDDYTAKEFVEHARSNPQWVGALEKKALVQHWEPGADHTLSELRFNSVVAVCTLNLISQLALH
jgi:uncharacterized protein